MTQEVSGTSRFVAEVGVFAAIHAGRGAAQRMPLEPPHAWGVERGYWDIWYLEDSRGVERPYGLLLTLELIAGSRLEAEDTSIDIGNRLGQLASFFAGSPPRSSRLLRLASTNIAGELLEQWRYFYDSELPPSIRLVPRELREFLRRCASTDESKRQTIELAARWYASSTGGTSALDKFLALWIGLEAIGPLLNDYYHPVATTVRCEVCQNKPGRRRKRMIAGVEHLVLRVAPELVPDGQTVTDLYDLRSEIVHGLRPQATLEEQVRPLIRGLQACLGVGTLAARDGPSSDPSYGWKGALPRDYEERPDARSALTSPLPLPDHHPFLGGWVEEERKFVDRKVSVNDAGEYAREGDIVVNHRASVPRGRATGADFVLGYDQFQRSGVRYTLENKNVTPSEPVEPTQWRDEPPNPAWERLWAAAIERVDDE